MELGVNTALTPSRGALRLVSPQEVTQHENNLRIEQDRLRAAKTDEQVSTSLARFLRERWEVFRNHRSTSGLDERLLAAQRVFNGQYDAAKLAEIQKFGGSTVYARLIAVKCRGATSLLRDLYMGASPTWDLAPTPDPVIPGNVSASIATLVSSEVASLQQAGQPITDDMVQARLQALQQAARVAARKSAAVQAERAKLKLNDYLVEDQFYQALADFLVDLPIFSFAVLKGPVVRIVPDVKWVNGQPAVVNAPRMFWERCSPFDIYFDPGVSHIADGAVIEKIRLSRSDLNDCIGLPGYNDEAIYKVLEEYGRGGLVDWITPTDNERAVQERRENPQLNRSGMLDALEFHGPVQGRTLLEHGFPAEHVSDPLRDIYVQAWLIGNHVIKVQLSPSPRKRHPYYVSSFEKLPGSPAGNGLPDILEDIQDVANAALRAMVNNLSIASGPQVMIEVDRLSPLQTDLALFPWKRWLVLNDPNASNTSRGPVSFFQPNSHAQELLGVYKELGQMADEISAIPRYAMGSERTSGAGRTASGLAMLMGNAGKILQTVAANIDRDVMDPSLQYLYDIVMMTDGGQTLRGDEAILVKGAALALAREAETAQALQFLQITGNPIDMSIIGPVGRAKVLDKLSRNLNLTDDIVPDEDTLKAQLAAAAPPTAPPGGPEQPPADATNAGPQAGPTNDDNRRLDITARQDPRSMPRQQALRAG